MRSGLVPHILAAVAVCAVSAGGAGTSARAADWYEDLASARAAAVESDRPLLLHFSASWCGPCRQMEPVLHSATVADVLRKDAVGVHLDFDRHKAIAQQYGVRGIPADVLLTPDGRVLGQMSGLKQPADYARRVRAVAGQYVSLKQLPKPELGPRIAFDKPEGPRISVTDPSWPAGLAAPGDDGDEPNLGPAVPDAAFDGAFGDSAPSATPPTRSPSDLYGGRPDPFRPGSSADPGAVDTPNAPPAGASEDRESRRPVPGTPRVVRRPTRKLLGMRGFCPVTLHLEKKWVRGKRDFQWEHQGITYFLASDAAFDKFYANADRYAPKLLGCDPVLYRDEGRAVPGSTTYAAIWRDDLFLFVSDENRKTFHADPSRYANGRQVLLIEEIEGVGTY
ncbi:thioredoxin domain-containing protein [Alienimonas sp. DA493]|uniref:thioredoxin domain-containing protein n=1 Tax=Alienimonas sp. DA493 TaxID=3373605 RepID=UPI0037546DA4